MSLVGGHDEVLHRAPRIGRRAVAGFVETAEAEQRLGIAQVGRLAVPLERLRTLLAQALAALEGLRVAQHRRGMLLLGGLAQPWHGLRRGIRTQQFHRKPVLALGMAERGGHPEMRHRRCGVGCACAR